MRQTKITSKQREVKLSNTERKVTRVSNTNFLDYVKDTTITDDQLVVTKSDSTEQVYDFPTELPDTGRVGNAVLTISTIDNETPVWATPANVVPQGGTTGQVLTKASDTDFDSEWADVELPVTYMEQRFAGKNIMFIGDSITGSSESGGTGSNWVRFIQERTGANCINVGMGGTTMGWHGSDIYRRYYLNGFGIAQCIDPNPNDPDNAGQFNWTNMVDAGQNYSGGVYLPQTERMRDTDWTDLDYIVIGYGTNDRQQGQGQGADLVRRATFRDPNASVIPYDINNTDRSERYAWEMTDAVSNDTTITGYLRYLLEVLKENCPKAKIVVWCPYFRDQQGYNLDGSRNGTDSDDSTVCNGCWDNSLQSDDYREVCREYKVEFLDMYHEGQFARQNFSYYYEDTTHLNDAGAENLADKMIEALLRA